MAALESLRRGGLVFGALGINGDEEDEDSPAVSSDDNFQCYMQSCSSQMHIRVFVYYQVLLSVLAQHGQMALCFYDSKDSSLHFMRDTPDNFELHLLARGKQCTVCYISFAYFPNKLRFMVFISEITIHVYKLTLVLALLYCMYLLVSV